MRLSIGLKIFSIAVALLILMTIVALLGMRMTRTVDAQLVIIDQNYFPAYVALARANVHSVEESAYVRRLILATAEPGGDEAKLDDLRQRVASVGKASDEMIADARRYINQQIADPLDFDDNIALARLDDKIEALQQERRRYEAVLVKLLAAAKADRKERANELLTDLDGLRDDFDTKVEAARTEMRRLAGAAIVGTRAYQQRVVKLSLALLVIAGVLGILVAAIVTIGLVRPVHRLLAGTAAVERGALDTVIPITSRDEIAQLTRSFNSMVGELRLKAQIRETFGKYVDPRIVAGLLERPELTDATGSRREMTIFFCDMKGFTEFSEGMTPAGLVNVLNRYMTMMSEPVRQNNGIIDKYLGDGIMAFWGPPFTGAEEQARLACMAALEQLAVLSAFRSELPELTGLKRGLPEIDLRIGIATGDVVAGSIGSEQTRNYTVIGDAVNLAARLEGANKVYGTRVLISEATNRLAAASIETREIDTVLVVGKTEPQRIFELLGHKGALTNERIALRDAFADALEAYRRRAWDEARAGFEGCLEI
ncbi:MAG: adenylate/guanylate cyclase domain-containing protein, partial [Stellaceae bacterium]